jgi:PPK2 family polyphosphate:nucleotide phosphotransferase
VARPLAVALDGSGKVHLDKVDPADTRGLDKEEGLARLEKLGVELTELVNLLTFAGQHALLVVVQGRDASGKDGVIRKVLSFCNVLSVHAESFKAPTTEERAHDFLWRVHRVAPRRGYFTMFNRSHYEDVIAARVHGLVPKEKWRARYDHINAFERLLGDNDTLLLKFYLHISRDEQYQRLIEREKGPRTAWKLDPNDWREELMWDEVTRAYQDAIDKCSSPDRPFYLVPSDRKWFRSLAVIERPFRAGWLEHLERMGKAALEEIKKIRTAAGRSPLPDPSAHRASKK